MALSPEFLRDLDELAGLVTADRSVKAVNLADAIRRQAEADQAALQAELAAVITNYERN